MGAFLPVSDLNGLKEYKYASEDHSLASKYILGPFYRKAIHLVPKCIAPNLVTLSGLFFSVFSIIRAWWYWHQGIDPPKYAYALYAFELFMYQTLDALDGLQARRTGTSSPLGELFDHCVDAINTSLQNFVFCTVMQFPPFMIFVAQFSCCLNFFVSTWEEFHTKKLYLSAFSGPVEGVLIIIGLYIWISISGLSIWEISLFRLSLPFKLHVALQTALTVFREKARVFVASFVYSNTYLMPIVLPVFQKLAVLIPTTVPAEVNVDFLGFMKVVSPVILSYNIASAIANVKKLDPTLFSARLQGAKPFLMLWAAFGVWGLLVWSLVSKSLFMVFYLQTSLLTALVIGRIITAHVTRSQFPMYTPVMLVPVAGIVSHFVAPQLDSAVLLFSGGIVFGVYSTFVAEIVAEITQFLGIYCLTIKKPETKE